ncbi:MAG: T9SS type A sorting domain-containing protein [Bacteroidota bacterium]
MKKYVLFFTVLLLFYGLANAQTTLFFQGFEGAAADTWGYTSGSVSTLTARTGSKSGTVGASGQNSTLLFNTVTLNSSCSGPILSLYHSVRGGTGPGMDTREGASVFVSLNGGAWAVLEQVGGFGDISWGWTATGGSASSSAGCNIYQAPNPITYNIPGGTTSIALKIVSCTGGSCATYNNNMNSGTAGSFDRTDEGFFIDDIKITTTSAITCATLPVTLTDFYAVKKNTSNDLIWKVASEESINYYSIEKSNNAIDFTPFGTVWPNADNFEMKSYSYTDTEPYNDITYYRLTTKEKNGSTRYYSIISIDENSSDWDFTHYQDASDIIVDFKNTIPKNGSVNLYSMDGKLISSQTIVNRQTKLSKGNIEDGIYFIRIVSRDRSENVKLVVQKD